MQGRQECWGFCKCILGRSIKGGAASAGWIFLGSMLSSLDYRCGIWFLVCRLWSWGLAGSILVGGEMWFCGMYLCFVVALGFEGLGFKVWF